MQSKFARGNDLQWTSVFVLSPELLAMAITELTSVASVETREVPLLPGDI